MSLWAIIFLGVLQGIAEFLPISSSGHLALARQFMGMTQNGLAIDVALHFGTLFSILWFYRKNFFQNTTQKLNTGGWRRIFLVGVGGGPVVIIGLIFGESIEKVGRHPHAVAGFLVFTGLLLFATKYLPDQKRFTLTFWRALGIGVIQVLALFPGVSRAGSTIVAGVFFGLSQRESADFSFQMAVPLLLGAAIYKFKEVLSFPTEDLGILVLGIVIAFFSGILALNWVISALRKHAFHYFSWYVWSVALLSLFWVSNN